MVVLCWKKLLPNRVRSQRDVKGLLRTGDELFETVCMRNQQVDWNDVKRLVVQTLQRYNVDIATDDEFEDDSTPSVQEFSDGEDDEDSEEEHYAVAAATENPLSSWSTHCKNKS
jgi:hypothetical protein